MKDEKKQKKEVLKKEMERLGSLQRECKEEKIPVYLLFDGYDGAGKGVQIGRLMQALDPRGFDVYTGDKDTEEETLRRSSGDLRSMLRQRGGSRSMTRAGTGESRRTALRGS